MDIHTAKALSIHDLLATIGHQPTKRTLKDSWYVRPYGNESHVSFS